MQIKNSLWCLFFDTNYEVAFVPIEVARAVEPLEDSEMVRVIASRFVVSLAHYGHITRDWAVHQKTTSVRAH